MKITDDMLGPWRTGTRREWGCGRWKSHPDDTSIYTGTAIGVLYARQLTTLTHTGPERPTTPLSVGAASRRIQMPATEQQIAEWEKLSDAATPGPWGRAGTEVTAKSIGYASVCDTETDNDKMCENAAFIAASREAIPALIADLREARAKLAEAEKDAQRYSQVRRGQHWSVVDGIGNLLLGESLDAAIDDAIAAQEKP